jgi:hypothetical protein
MKYVTGKSSRFAFRSFVVLVGILALAALPLLSHASVDGGSVVVTNSSSRAIRFIYISPVDNDSWSDNKLARPMAPGEAVTLSTDACPGSNMRVISEDMDGCFVYSDVSCGGTAALTITDDAIPNCGN